MQNTVGEQTSLSEEGEVVEKTYGGSLARLGLGSELLTRGLATSGLASGLLGTGHC